MTTKDMLRFMKSEGYSLTLMATQSSIDYFKLYRHLRDGGNLTENEKARLWRFALCQPVLEEKIIKAAKAENSKRERA